MIAAWDTGTTELAPGVFAYVQAYGGLCVANAGVVAGRNSVTSIDALFTPSMTRTLLAETARIAPKPITRLLNTHHHVDHTLGNSLFPADTQIVAHARAKAEMERSGLSAIGIIKKIAPHFAPELNDVSLRERLPDVTFDGETLDLVLDERRIRLLHFGTGHTRGDVLVYLPDNRILFTGDLGFLYVTPLAHEGHIGNWIRVGRRVLDEIDADIVVGGHGPIGTKRDLAKMQAYLALVHGGARRAFDAGASEREAVESIDLGEYAEWVEAERIVPNVMRCYQEFRGEIML
jgi:cyclase